MLSAGYKLLPTINSDHLMLAWSHGGTLTYRLPRVDYRGACLPKEIVNVSGDMPHGTCSLEQEKEMM